MVKDFEHLLTDFENLTEAESTKVIESRLSDIKGKNVSGMTEKDFYAFISKVKKNAK